MRDASHDSRLSLFGRRNFLRTAGVAAGSLAVAGTASAYHGRYDEVVNIVEEGADNSGGESINPVLEDVAGDSVLVEFPDGEYKMDRHFRHTNFDEFGLVATGDDATIVPVPADDWGGEPRMFKLGTNENPGGRVRIEGLTFDFTAPNTGLRAIQTQAASPYVRAVTVEGRHDTGNWGPGPLLVDVVDPNGTGRVERVNLRDGGVMEESDDSVSLGPIGFSITPDHVGELTVNRTRVQGFPSNGFYCSSDRGRTIVEKGVYQNNNVANIRLAGRNSEVHGSHVNVTRNPDGWDSQVGIRLDGGHDYVIDGVRVYCPKPTANAIRVMGNAGRATLRNAWVYQGEPKEDAVFVDDGSGPVKIEDSTIRKMGNGQAVEIQGPGGDVGMYNVGVYGDAPGGDGGSHAIRCERDGCHFHWMHVHQPGDDYRRAMTILGDGCTVVGGYFYSTHHGIVVDADDFT